MCYRSLVRRSLAFVALVTVALAGCQADSQPDHQSEWRDVLRHKRAAVSPAASPRDKQVYADSVSAFVQRHPNHSRAREVYDLIRLEFADELFSAGRYQDAIRFYRAILAANRDNEAARRGLSASLERLAVSREKLMKLEKGMSRRQVAHLLGRPVPGWTVEKKRSGVNAEAWYYRTMSGSIAGVYFRDGKVFAAEENSQAKTGL
jgi:hypothetical protein